MLEFAAEDPPAVRKVAEDWQNAADREARSRTVFAQEMIKFTDVAREVDAVRSAIGSGVDVAAFVKTAMRHYRATLSQNGPVMDVGLGDVTFPLPVDGRSFRARFELPVREGEIYLHRTYPLVEALATGILDVCATTLYNALAAWAVLDCDVHVGSGARR